MSHTQGKLSIRNKIAIYCAGSGSTIAVTSVSETDVDDARRLVACWNACEGISTERLEDLGRPLMAHLIGCDERAARQLKERNELLAALTLIRDAENSALDLAYCKGIASAAIERVTP